MTKIIPKPKSCRYVCMSSPTRGVSAYQPACAGGVHGKRGEEQRLRGTRSCVGADGCSPRTAITAQCETFSAKKLTSPCDSVIMHGDETHAHPQTVDFTDTHAQQSTALFFAQKFTLRFIHIYCRSRMDQSRFFATKASFFSALRASHFFLCTNSDSCEFSKPLHHFAK